MIQISQYSANWRKLRDLFKITCWSFRKSVLVKVPWTFFSELLRRISSTSALRKHWGFFFPVFGSLSAFDVVIKDWYFQKKVFAFLNHLLLGIWEGTLFTYQELYYTKKNGPRNSMVFSLEALFGSIIMSQVLGFILMQAKWKQNPCDYLFKHLDEKCCYGMGRIAI